MTTSEYAAAGRPARITRKHLDTGAHLYTGEVSYDKFNNLKTFKEQMGSERTAFAITFTHDNENRPTLLNFGSSRQVAYVYDGLGRISRRTVNAGGTDVATTYSYLAGGHGTGSTTPLMETITQSGATLTYTYDDASNITSVSDGAKTISYEYDLLGQLTRVNDPYDTTAGSTGTTWKYAYDQGGNIQSKTAYAFTTGTVGTAIKTDVFTYGDANWKDKLTAFNGTTITYDAIGNPINDGTWNYTWNGRQMRATHKGNFGEPGYDEITYDYNEDGLRTKKTRMYYDDATGDIGYKATSYTLHGKNIVHMTENGNELHFFYDVQNKPAVVVFNGTAYAYLYNLQGDVIGLVDNNSTKMVSYSYDAWGKMLSKTGTLASTLGTIQPFRYRGYVFDEETGLYYLRSRYFNPNLCRFVNADSHLGFRGEIFAHNVYTYCVNSPVCLLDNDGLVWTMGAYEPYYGFYHSEVQKWIVAHNVGVAMEVSTSTGRIDLYNVCSHEIYEVKPDRPEHIEAGKAQLKRYMRGNLPTQLGNACNLVLPPDGTLHYEYEDVVVDVSVRAEGPLILYSAKQTRKKKQQTVPEPVVVPERARERERQYALQPSWTTAAAMAIFLWGLITPLPGDEAIGLGLLLAP